ncbi:MFS transporter [Nocardioides marmorisolisilvae]|uniref:MFS transporter n=1 Tax=Nocardioides marmorisolisilvae TaxID=1542737 RepID=A0A3N0DT72_9ACTN|nr:MFS transporter [Nocardioides marmorisolisilvae]RNL78835.1 MFS transporter [Nocardioides marmorisolisilvae]
MADPGVGRGLFAARLTASLMPLNSTMIAVAVPSIAHQFHHSSATVTQALVATYLIAAIALQSPGGKLGDRIGHWRVFALGQGAIGLGAVLGFLAPSLAVLATSRILMATGGALVVPATVALLRVELPPEQRGRAFGSFGATMAFAAALGPILGGVLVDAFGWEAVFLANVPVLAVSAILAASVQHVRTPSGTAAFDWPGSALLTAGLVLVVLGAQQKNADAWPLLAVGAVLLCGFGWWEGRAGDPVVAFDLFRSLPFTAGTLLIGLQNLVMYALLFELPLVLENRFDLKARETGQLLIFLMVAMVLLSLVAGRLTDRLGPRPLAVTGSAVCLAGILVMLRSDLHHSGDVRLPLALLGVGLGLSGPAAQTASLSAIDAARSGMAAGVSSTMRYLGGVAGIALLGRLVDLHGSRAEVLHEHHTVVAVFTGVLVVGLACALALPGPAARATSTPVEQVPVSPEA